MNAVVWIPFCLLAAIGLVQAGGWLWRLLIRPGQPARGYCVCSLSRDNTVLESQLRYCLNRRGWCGADDALILVDNGLDEEGLAICRRMTEGALGVLVCTPGELARMIQGAEAAREEQEVV